MMIFKHTNIPLFLSWRLKTNLGWDFFILLSTIDWSSIFSLNMASFNIPLFFFSFFSPTSNRFSNILKAMKMSATWPGSSAAFMSRITRSCRESSCYLAAQINKDLQEKLWTHAESRNFWQQCFWNFTTAVLPCNVAFFLIPFHCLATQSCLGTELYSGIVLQWPESVIWVEGRYEDYDLSNQTLINQKYVFLGSVNRANISV